ncbi:hypothetical protein BpHYR1_019892 [Brachionus plicatilis]|uniref:Uncharacterized protein n=1 Tax=Brachionus plicatilis TaxID=10195 RepID=A0A3M7T8T8_BRAPC|nr:hypothetical protein BpHYR1_019892 [Brachionus plicatilis]
MQEFARNVAAYPYGVKECKSCEKCIRCGDDNHLLPSCKYQPRCINCKGNHQSNNNLCCALVNKTIQLNKYTLDLMLKEGIIKSIDEIIRPPVITPFSGNELIECDDRFKNLINSLIDTKLRDQNIRLETLEQIKNQHSKEFAEVKTDLNLMKNEIVEVKSDVRQTRIDVSKLTTSTNNIENSITAILAILEKPGSRSIQLINSNHHTTLSKKLKIATINVGGINNNIDLIITHNIVCIQETWATTRIHKTGRASGGLAFVVRIQDSAV